MGIAVNTEVHRKGLVDARKNVLINFNPAPNPALFLAGMSYLDAPLTGQVGDLRNGPS